MWTTSDHASSSPHRRLKRLSNAPPGDALFAADFQNLETAHRHHVKPALLSALSRSQHSPCSAARSPSQLHVCLAAALQTSQRLSSGQSFTSGGRWPGCSSGHVLVGPCLSRRNQNSPGMDLTRLTVRATSSLVRYHHIICSKFILGGIRASAMEFVSEHRRLYRSWYELMASAPPNANLSFRPARRFTFEEDFGSNPCPQLGTYTVPSAGRDVRSGRALT
mmetsp:Transcript_6324/g.27858  ORF Transcript_6324/g.27858 Transcript_6324/m.27858 type:complete len:221 (-) Transcript_6324:750-1412(-)